jgi:CRP-like cAMP-binding protein
LPRTSSDALLTNGQIVSLPQGAVLGETGHEASEVFFPLAGMVSLVVVMKNGRALETATVGREGMVSGMAGLGVHISHVRAVVQIEHPSLRISATAFRRIASKNRAIEALCVSYNEILLAQARITAACNSLHPVEARFCRWLLQTSDRAGPNHITLTQEFLSEMLGVRRTSVTDAAKPFSDASIISYSRGVITIHNRKKLLEASCECYETLRELAPA